MRHAIVLAVLAGGLFITLPSNAQKRGAQPEEKLPCKYLEGLAFNECLANQTNCLDNGGTTASCGAQATECRNEAVAEYQDCVAEGGQASTQPFLSLTPSAIPAALNHSRQSRSLLIPVSN